MWLFFFFFQAEDGIRDGTVTGVQTCALPIMLVATPSGLTLAPEGGAHQSASEPLIGLAQADLACFEPAFVDELAVLMRWGFAHMQAEEGSSIYLRLSTRPLDQRVRQIG